MYRYYYEVGVSFFLLPYYLQNGDLRVFFKKNRLYDSSEQTIIQPGTTRGPDIYCSLFK